MLFIKMNLINQEFHLIWIHTGHQNITKITNQEHSFSEQHALISRPVESIEIYAINRNEQNCITKINDPKLGECHSHVCQQTGSSIIWGYIMDLFAYFVSINLEIKESSVYYQAL